MPQGFDPMEHKAPTPAPAWTDEFVEDWYPVGAPVIGYWQTLSDSQRSALTSVELCELCCFLMRTIPFAEVWREQGSSSYQEVLWYANHIALPYPERLLAWLSLEMDNEDDDIVVG